MHQYLSGGLVSAAGVLRIAAWPHHGARQLDADPESAVRGPGNFQ